MIVGLLGGRAAEDVVFDTVTTGASNDIEKATSLARSMITRYGMSKHFGLMGLETVESQYLDGRTSMNCSDVTAAAVDEEVMKLLKSCYKEAKTMIKENRAIMDKIAAHLIEKETITGKEFMEIYCKEKGIPVPVKDDDKKLKKKDEQVSDSETDVIEKENEEKKKQPEMMDFREVLTEVRKDNAEEEKSVSANDIQNENSLVQNDDSSEDSETESKNEQE